jgi:hypothetical protein
LTSVIAPEPGHAAMLPYIHQDAPQHPTKRGHDMRYRQLGESGLTVSVIGLGSNNFGGRIGLEETRGVVDAAITSTTSLMALLRSRRR